MFMYVLLKKKSSVYAQYYRTEFFSASTFFSHRIELNVMIKMEEKELFFFVEVEEEIDVVVVLYD